MLPQTRTWPLFRRDDHSKTKLTPDDVKARTTGQAQPVLGSRVRLAEWHHNPPIQQVAGRGQHGVSRAKPTLPAKGVLSKQERSRCDGRTCVAGPGACSQLRSA